MDSFLTQMNWQKAKAIETRQ